MAQGGQWSILRGIALGAALISVNSFAQDKPLPDAQIESNVLKALAGVPELADQAIGSTTVYGTVTLSGSVRDEASRNKAEQTVANTPGVKKVVDELIVGAPADTNNAAQANDQAPANPTPPDQSENPAMQQDGSMSQPNQQQPASPQMPPPAERQPPQGYPYPQNNPYPPQGYPPQPQAGNGYPPQQQYPPQRPYRVQEAGQSVVVPAGTLLRVRINQAMDSRHTPPGTVFDGVVINNVFIGGAIAIPRGATVQGRVSDGQPGGDLKGRGILALELTQVTLEGHTYPLGTTTWNQQGYDKTGQTVGNTVGLGAVGAMIGAIAGGGPGALLGAGIGGVAGLGVSSASKSGEATIPAEAIVNFKLSQQAALTTVSQAELDRLGAGLPQPYYGQPQMRRRYYPPPPPPPPPYAPYPYPYYYPYYR